VHTPLLPQESNWQNWPAAHGLEEEQLTEVRAQTPLVQVWLAGQGLEAEQAVQSGAGCGQLTGVQAPTLSAVAAAFTVVQVWPPGQGAPSQQLGAQTPELVQILSGGHGLEAEQTVQGVMQTPVAWQV
jgi:hypothetical protein